MRRSRFTINNWTEETKYAVLHDDKFVYCIVGEELAPTTGTPHLQGYAEFKKPTNLPALAKKYHGAFFTCEADQAHNIAYCKKDGIFEEFGTPRPDPKKGGQIEKDRWANNLADAKAGNLEAIAERDPAAFVRMYRTLKEIKKDYMQPLPVLEDLDNWWICGEPGIGKSYMARETAGQLFYPKPLNKWWDGYQGEEFVIIDDYEKDCHLDHYIKIWADKYDFIAETKGGSMRIRPKHIIVTSNYMPEECFLDPVLCEAVRRRFKVKKLAKL